MKLLAALIMFGMASASASSSTSVRVEVEAKPNLTFSRGASSGLTLTTPWGTQQASFRSGTPYEPDPEHYYSRLDPVTLRVNVPTVTKPGGYPVSLNTVLYVCDQAAHLCSVRPAQASGKLTVGLNAAPLTLTLKVPKLRSS